MIYENHIGRFSAVRDHFKYQKYKWGVVHVLASYNTEHNLEIDFEWYKHSFMLWNHLDFSVKIVKNHDFYLAPVWVCSLKAPESVPSELASTRQVDTQNLGK